MSQIRWSRAKLIERGRFHVKLTKEFQTPETTMEQSESYLRSSNKMKTQCQRSVFSNRRQSCVASQEIQNMRDDTWMIKRKSPCVDTYVFKTKLLSWKMYSFIPSRSWKQEDGGTLMPNIKALPDGFKTYIIQINSSTLI